MDNEIDLEENYPGLLDLSSDNEALIRRIDDNLSVWFPEDYQPHVWAFSKGIWYITLRDLSRSQKEMFWKWVKGQHPELRVGSA